MLAELAQKLRRDEGAVDRKEDGGLVRGRAKPGDDACDRRLRLRRLDQHLEGKWKVALANGDPFLAGLAKRPPRPLGERLPSQAGECFRRPEPRRCSADEQDAG